MADQGTGGQALSERARVLDSNHDVVLESALLREGAGPILPDGEGESELWP